MYCRALSSIAMIYLSKGILCRYIHEHRIYVRQMDLPRELVGLEAVLWMNGRSGFGVTKSNEEEVVIKSLAEKWYVCYEPENTPLSQYRILTKCLLYPVRGLKRVLPLFDRTERKTYLWLKKAGLNLNIAEIICIEEKGIEPKKELFHRKNAQKLHDSIYPNCINYANALESRMKNSIARKRTVDAVMRLIQKQRLIVL